MMAPNRNRAAFEDLENRIHSSAGTDQSVETTLSTNDRIIARVTDGIYREPWAAFRELIANAYDADASYVIIETGQPDFVRMTVSDDGLGMTPKTLAYVLNNIGGSSKRTAAGREFNTVQKDHPNLSPGGRPLIGKIGIGVFAVAQLTKHFQIITKSAGELYRLTATVSLNTHDEETMLADDSDYVAGNVKILSHPVPEEEIGAHGTQVVLFDMHPEVRRTLQSERFWDSSSVNTDDGEAVKTPPVFHVGYSSNKLNKSPHLPWKHTDKPDAKFRRFFESVGESTGKSAQSANLDRFDEYLQLIWKLSLSLPVRYIDTHPFDLDGSSGIAFFGFPNGRGQAEPLPLASGESVRTRLGLSGDNYVASLPLSVTLDGVKLSRPVHLPSSLRKASTIGKPFMIAARQDNPFPDSDLRRAGGRLSFESYLYWNSQIVPKETSGVLIRVRGASGTLFDPTFLNYRISEQNRLRQITAEIFVHEGLDGAINIDRESFNYSHPHFLYIQRWLHRALRLLVNRLKAAAAAKRTLKKAEQRNRALRFAEEVWTRRLGLDVDPPLADPSAKSLPEEVGGAEIEWPPEPVFMDGRKRAGTGRISALAIVLEAYGLLSELPIQDRARVLSDVIAIPETRE